MTDHKAEAEKFLEENAAKDGIQQTESGVQYRILETGSGNKPNPNSMVEVHYTGKFLSGQTFDSSRDRGQTTSFPVNGVIKGWTDALLLMQEGDRWELWIPPHLGYGERGYPGAIPGNALLYFDVELVKVS